MQSPNVGNIVRIKESVEGDLLKRPGVTGVDVGFKYVGGKKTNQIAIRVLVAEKKDVPPAERIPDTIQGVKTDVIQRKFVLTSFGTQAAAAATLPDTTRYDPLVGGISLGACRLPGAIGTMGAIVTDNVSGNPMLLSCFHVMCDASGWTVGDTMVQPAQGDGGVCPTDVVGTLAANSLGALVGTALNNVDCAVATITARGNSCSIVDVGNVTGTAMASLGIPVRKRGRTTGLTFGAVDSISLSFTINYGGSIGNVAFTNQIGIQADTTRNSVFQDGGDSGAVAVNDANAVIGLMFAADTSGAHGIANPIQSVLNALNVSVCIGATVVPVVTGINPTNGPTAGGTQVGITGSGFTGVTAAGLGVTGSPSVTPDPNTPDTLLTAVSPSGSGTVDVTVTTPNGTSAATNTDLFTYIPPPTVTSIAPNNGPAAVGTGVTIMGTGFTGANAVNFGTASASFQIESDTQISATSPVVNFSGVVDVTVTTPNGTSAINPQTDQFTFM